eukprot:g21667.t1
MHCLLQDYWKERESPLPMGLIPGDNKLAPCLLGMQEQASHLVILDRLLSSDSRAPSSPQKLLNIDVNDLLVTHAPQVEQLDMGREVPEDWITANVVPLFGKGGRDKSGNCRQMSLRSVVGKLLEKILKQRINLHSE